MEKLWHYVKVATLVTLFLALVGSELAHAATTDATDGYVSRPCGFDNDKDGDYGESGECDYCDGNQSTGAFNTTDPDGDGVNEDFIYVDCNSGVDEAGCGEPDDACRSIEYALGLTDGTSFDSDGAGGTFPGTEEDIICVRATCGSYNNGLTPGSISISVTEDGKCDGASCVNSLTTRNANVGPETGNAEEYNYTYPDDPFMIVGWDTDNDGVYPPHDTDQPEPAVLDGCSSSGQETTCTSNSGNTFLQLSGAQRFQMAHLSIINMAVVPVGENSQTTRYAIGWTGAASPKHQRIHDIVLKRNVLNVSSFSSHATLYFGMSSQNFLSYVALENILEENNGGWPMRGWIGASATYRGNNLRMRNMTVLNHDNQHSVTVGPTGGQTQAFKWWSANDTEIIDNAFLDPDQSGNNQVAVYPSIANSGIVIRSNTFRNYSQPIQNNWRDTDSDAPNSDCDGLDIDRNYFHWTSIGGFTSGIVMLGANATNGQERTECPSGGCGTAEPCNADGGAGGNNDCDCNGNQRWLKNVNVTNNVIDGANFSGADGGIVVKLGDNCWDAVESNFGPVTIANNTFKNWNPGSSDIEGIPRGAIIVGRHMNNDWDYKYVKGDVRVFNNLITGLSSDVAVQNIKRGGNGCGPTTGTTCTAASWYTPDTDWFSDNNVYQGTGISFVRGDDCSTNSECPGTATCGSGDRCTYSGLAAWQGVLTNQEVNSKTCTPTFEGSSARLASGDTCAQDAGNNTYCPAVDFAGNARSDGDCDIGAYEVQAAASPGTVQLGSVPSPVGEASTIVTVPTTRTGGSSGAAAVNHTTSSGTATGGASCTAGVDYITASGTENWGDGVTTSQTFDVTICNDTAVEGSESFTVSLSGATGATLGSPSSATITIADDDVAPSTPRIEGDFVSSCPSGTGITVTIPGVDGMPAGAGNDRLLAVLVSATADYNAGAPTDPNCDMSLGGAGVTFDGTGMTRMVSRVDNNGPTYSECVAIFGLLAPADVVGTVIVTFPGTVRTRNAAAVVLSGVEQTLPSGGPNDDGTIGAPATRSMTVSTTAPDSVILDVLGLGNRVDSGNATPGAGQTQIAEISCGTTGNHMLASSKFAITPQSTNMSWSWLTGTPERYAHASIVVPPAPTPPTTNAPTTTTSTTTTNTLPDPCGDGNIDAGEECDTADLNGKKCSNFPPLAEGTLDCNPDCTYDFSACTLNKRGRIGVRRVLSWCESGTAPTCGGTCPDGFSCVDVGGSCDCQ